MEIGGGGFSWHRVRLHHLVTNISLSFCEGFLLQAVGSSKKDRETNEALAKIAAASIILLLLKMLLGLLRLSASFY